MEHVINSGWFKATWQNSYADGSNTETIRINLNMIVSYDIDKYSEESVYLNFYVGEHSFSRFVKDKTVAEEILFILDKYFFEKRNLR